MVGIGSNDAVAELRTPLTSFAWFCCIFLVLKLYSVYKKIVSALQKISCTNKDNKNSSGDEIANVNFYAVHPEATWIRWNNAK